MGKGDRVALHAHNSSSFVFAFLGLARLGAIAVPINFMLGATEVGFICDHAGVTGAIVEDALVGNVAIDGMQVVIGEAVDGWEDFEALLAHEDATEPDVRIEDDHPVAITYTSGTESRPKGAVLTSRSLISQFVSCIVDCEFTAGDVELHPMPLYHCAQLFVFLMPDLYVGATNVILPGADPATILRNIEEHGITKLFVAPTVWIGMLRHPDFDTRDLSTLKKGFYGASPMPVEVLQELARRLGDVELYNLYGQTEMAPVATLLRPEDQLRKPGSAGHAALNVDTMVVDDDDAQLPVGEIGEIVHRSPHAMTGYYNDDEKTAAAFKSGWFHSGDLGFVDDDGYLFVVDRKKDMIKSGGENVASREVEECIYEHPSVEEVAIFGVPDERWIEAVTAAIVVRGGGDGDADAIHAHCREKLAGYKRPKHVVFVDALPKNASGKIVKRDLRDQFSNLGAK
ncbi:MAG: fatty-acyl-CoA synthase [Solirubrobacteraceae bacterium]|nr:fatty-acyl-CoA synthase [Solirubrobacteraceae bacterium]